MTAEHPPDSRAIWPGVQLDRTTLATAVSLLLITAAAWAALLLQAPSGGAMSMSELGAPTGEPGMAGEMSMRNASSAEPLAAIVFVAAWLVMMVAMMLPSAAPMVLLYRATATGSRLSKAIAVVLFVSAYVLMWGVFGLAVYAAQQAIAMVASNSAVLSGAWPFAVAGVLALAGAYQFSALKSICLRQCRTPLSFLMTRWRPGLVGGFRLGLDHGAYCVGCCWGLMTVLVAAGAMGLAWAALVALVVFTEKLLPRADIAGRAVGFALLLLAALVAIRPETVSALMV
jgi:predicted metal-binding membrane protein